MIINIKKPHLHECRVAGGRYDDELGTFDFPKCSGTKCAHFNPIPLVVDDKFTAAIVQAARDIGDKSSNHLKAIEHVRANLGKYGLPTEPTAGECGLKPIPLKKILR